MARGNWQAVSFEVPRANVIIALLLALSFMFVYTHYRAPLKTVEIQKALAVIVKEKQALQQQDKAGGAGNSNSSSSNDQDNNDQDGGDDASPDPDEVYQA